MAMFELRKTIALMLALGLLATALMIVFAEAPTTCMETYLETGTGNHGLSGTLARPEPEQLREHMGPEALSWAESMEYLATTLCDAP